MANGEVVLFLCGDVMLGRGVDQILPHPGDPRLQESYAGDAGHYVRLAEATSGTIPKPASFAWPWGDALGAIAEAAADVRIVNLETSVTTSDDFAPDKPVCYRMHPANLPALAAVRPDVCTLANNHVLDFGRAGLAETLAALHRAGLRTAGAGPDAAAAHEPAAVPLPGGGRVLVYSCGMPSSGVPAEWAATDDRSGIDFAPGAATLVERAWS
ncbi:MAG: hypothetical protein HOV68_08175, partial [Streptomycetaceae bacterium]|nr:hypothetical protein [Streptomycetaceae bacterium]